MFKMGDKVNIKHSSKYNSESMDEKFCGCDGKIVGINIDRPSLFSVEVKDVGTNPFWEEELELVSERQKTREDWKKEAYDKGAKSAKDLSDALNSMTFDSEVTNGFVGTITSQHRTLQQITMKSIYKLMMVWASMEEAGYYDERNEATVKFCKSIKDKFGNDNYNFPFI